VIAVISLVISAAAFILAALLPLWEKYAPPKVVLRPPDLEANRGWWLLKVVNRRRDVLHVNEAWTIFDDGSVQQAFIDFKTPSGTIPARSTQDFQVSNDAMRGAVVFTKHAVSGSTVVAFCEDGVGRVYRSRPIDLRDKLTPFAGRKRVWSIWRWWWFRLRGKRGRGTAA
jgi:hypothetical protein